MHFDLAPKEKLEDLYDIREIYNRLVGLLKVPVQRNPLIVVRGVRRAGKTSLIKTALNELKLPYLYINGGRFADMPVIEKEDLLEEFERGLNEAIEKEKKWWKEILEVLRGVEWLKVDSKPPFVHFEWRRRLRHMDIPDLIFAFQRLSWKNKTRFVLVLDEAQEFKRLVDYKLQKTIADIFDHRHEIQTIVSGSQVGLLDDFLEVDDPEAPLFGRGTADITVPRLPRDLAVDFLRRGSKQAGVKTDQMAISQAADRLDGVIGWLTLFGHELVAGNSAEKALIRTIEKGKKLEAQELEHFLRAREQSRKRYVLILKRAAEEPLGLRWIDLKESLEIRQRRTITNKRFSDLLGNLVKAGFLDKKENRYFIPDPLLTRALQSKLVR